MILSNSEIIRCLNEKSFSIDNLAGRDPTKSPFNTSAVDLRLAAEIQIPTAGPAALDLRQPGIAQFIARNSETHEITSQRPYTLKKGMFVLAKTMERVDFPINAEGKCYSARVEGKSSLARCGILVHFTAPTIHSGFNGTITLEIINLGAMDFLLAPQMFVCQLIIEEISGCPVDAPNQFRGQNNPAGTI